MLVTILIVVTTILMAVFDVRDDAQPWFVALVVLPALALGAPAPLFG
jgi:hypothetical protein